MEESANINSILNKKDSIIKNLEEKFANLEEQNSMKEQQLLEKIALMELEINEINEDFQRKTMENEIKSSNLEERLEFFRNENISLFNEKQELLDTIQDKSEKLYLLENERDYINSLENKIENLAQQNINLFDNLKEKNNSNSPINLENQISSLIGKMNSVIYSFLIFIHFFYSIFFFFFS